MAVSGAGRGIGRHQIMEGVEVMETSLRKAGEDLCSHSCRAELQGNNIGSGCGMGKVVAL